MTTTPTRINRPDLRKPDTYHILVDETMLTFLEEGLLARAAALQTSLMAHNECDMTKEDGCAVRQDWMINRYGSVKEAKAQGARLTDCSEDLHFLHASMSQLMDFVLQARHIRNNPESRGFRDLSDAEAKLLTLKGEVAYRNSQMSVATGQMEKLTPEVLAAMDAERATDAETSLLGLHGTENGPKPPKTQNNRR